MEFPQTEKQKMIYDFWRIRGFGKVTAVFGNVNVSLHHDNPRYESLGISYQYLEQFWDEAYNRGKEDERCQNNQRGQ